MELFLFLIVVTLCTALPVKEKEKQEEVASGSPSDDWESNLEYGRYLKEVVQALESDVEFRKKLESADVDDIKSGKIARELHFVDHNVRTKLDEIKRQELERLRHLALQEHEKKTGRDPSRLKIPIHVDHRNPGKFESEDLRKLIMKLNVDLEDLDKQRQAEFKKYEMEKEFNYQKELNEIQDETKRQEMKKQHEEMQKKHKEHPKLHHPGSKAQLQEVWEEEDHMEGEEFDHRTFFHLHDLDGNGVWDETEVKALFRKELDKMYDPNASEDDNRERAEEMERMREHVIRESDLDGDNLISFDEFMEQTRKTEYERDEGWQGLDEQELYSQQEYEEYTRQKQEEIRRLIESGAIPGPSPHLVPPMAAPNQVPYGMSNVPMQGLPQGYQHPQVQQGQVYQVPQGQIYQQVPQGQAYQQGQMLHQNPQVQAHQQVPSGYQQLPAGEIYQQVPQGYQPVAQHQGYRQDPHGQIYQPNLNGQGHQGQVQQGQGYKEVASDPRNVQGVQEGNKLQNVQAVGNVENSKMSPGSNQIPGEQNAQPSINQQNQQNIQQNAIRQQVGQNPNLQQNIPNVQTNMQNNMIPQNNQQQQQQQQQNFRAAPINQVENNYIKN